MTSLRDAARRICADRGLDPDTADLDPYPVMDRRSFHRAQIDAAIAAAFSGTLATATVDHPRVAAWTRAHIADPGRYPSLMLIGNTGVGKTHQAVGIIRAIGHHRATLGCGLEWALVDHPALNERLRPKSDRSHEWALDRYLNAELLVLDDLGAGQRTEYAIDNLQRLVDHRVTRALPTVYTTNLDDAELTEAVGARVSSRMGPASQIVIDGNDRRWSHR